MSVWWFGLSSQLENIIRNCPTWVQERQNPRQPFVRSERPSRPWQIVAIDLFKCDAWYLIVTVYYSRYFEICSLSRLTDAAVIGGSDNGSQFVSSKFQSFANIYNFQVITSSPHFPQSNGCVEAVLKIANNLLKEN
ncbi:hypothetical protein PR048_016087 [Dryococelus australis]|uniref:Integrase catalytic domain-containing protein n=1 Tax=Dryococelus australis TaxID=614101 RepID=A0ABQ9HJ57_9NEOP|nr:hypothetical protein PR048_016087 [Dryococelus australis]